MRLGPKRMEITFYLVDYEKDVDRFKKINPFFRRRHFFSPLVIVSHILQFSQKNYNNPEPKNV